MAIFFIKVNIFTPKENLNTENITNSLIFEKQNGVGVENILTTEESNLYKYNIKSYGGTAYVKLSSGKKMTLRKALLDNIINMNFLIEKADEDMDNKKIEFIMWQDGGSKEYRYDNYTIIKLNKVLRAPMNTDVYICTPETTVSDLAPYI